MGQRIGQPRVKFEDKIEIGTNISVLRDQNRGEITIGPQ
jgi:hypothetical protein